MDETTYNLRSFQTAIPLGNSLIAETFFIYILSFTFCEECSQLLFRDMHRWPASADTLGSAYVFLTRLLSLICDLASHGRARKNATPNNKDNNDFIFTYWQGSQRFFHRAFRTLADRIRCYHNNQEFLNRPWFKTCFPYLNLLW